MQLIVTIEMSDPQEIGGQGFGVLEIDRHVGVWLGGNFSSLQMVRRSLMYLVVMNLRPCSIE